MANPRLEAASGQPVYWHQWRHISHQMPPQPILDPAEPCLTSLNALHAQFVAFQNTLGNVTSDVKEVLSQLHAVRTAQNKTDKCVAVLEGVIGVSSTKGRGRRRGGNADADDPNAGEKTLIQSVASIQSAIDQLLARSPSHLSVNHQATANLTPSVNPTGQEPSHLQLFPILHSTHSTSSAAHSGSSSPIASPIPSHTPPGNECADLSDQGCDLSRSSSYSYSYVPGFTPAKWTVYPATFMQPPISIVPPTVHSSSHTHHPSAPSTVTDSQSSQSDSNALRGSPTSYIYLPIHTTSTPTIPPAACSPSNTLVLPPTSVTTMTSLTPEAADPSPGMEPSSDSQMLPAPPLSSLANVGDTPILVTGTSMSEHPVQPHMELNSEHPQMNRVGSDTISGTGTANIPTSEAVPAAYGRQSTPVQVDGQRLPCGLPTPPSDASSDDHEPRVVSHVILKYGDAMDRNPASCTYLPRNLPVVPTPSLTPESSVQEDLEMNSGEHKELARQDSLGVFSGSISPLTPPRFASLDALSEEVVGEAGGMVTGSDVVGVIVDFTSTTNSGPALTATNEPLRSIAVSNDDSSPTPQAVVGAELFITPGSSVGQTHVELPERHYDADEINPAYSQMGGYDLRFSSPMRHSSPFTSATPSRYVTPSDSNSRPTQEEDEVGGALTLGISGSSTPVLDYASLPLMFSHQPSPSPSTPLPHSSQQLSVDPSMLHDPPILPLDSDNSLSPLTSLIDTDEEQDAQRPNKRLRASATPVAPKVLETMDGRAGSRASGGPSASLNQLALLTRRDPLKIHLKLPQTMRSTKRKRDAFEDEGNEMRGWKDIYRDTADDEASIPVGIASQEGQVSENMVPARTKTVTSITSAPTLSVSQLAPQNSISSGPAVDRSVHGGKEAHPTSAHVSVHQKKHERAPKVKPKSPLKFHVCAGRIVSIELPTPELQPQTSVTSSMSQPSIHVEKAGQDPALVRHEKGQENVATKTPSSPATRPTTSGLHLIKSSPTKEDVVGISNKTWPELPMMFSSWDQQWIQCDKCTGWYHYGCVAIKPGDPRIEPETLFICLGCHTQCKGSRRHSLRADKCARPDCPDPHAAEDAYYVEKLVGRKNVEGYIYMWLAKWEGYPMNEATWIPKENVIGDGTRLFEAFDRAAKTEGADLSRNVVLLREAREGGLVG